MSNVADAAVIAAAIGAIVVALTEVTKSILPVRDAKYLPGFPIVYGVAIALLGGWGSDTHYSYGAQVLGGLIAGLVAAGAYSAGKTALGK